MVGPNKKREREEVGASDAEPVSLRLTEDMVQERHAVDAEGRAAVIARVSEIIATLEKQGRPATSEEQRELARYAPADASVPREERASEILDVLKEEAPDAQNVIVMDDPDVVGTAEGRAFTLTVRDELGANVARALYPEATVKQGRTERASIPDQLYDAVVVNARDTGETVWAFGKANVSVVAAQLERAIRSVKRGGIVVAEVPITLSDRNPSIRSAITMEAEFLDMFRVREPDGSWRDVIVFRRLELGEVAPSTSWTRTAGQPFMFRVREPDGSWRDVITLRLFEYTEAEVDEGRFRPITVINAYLEENPDAIDGDLDAFVHEADAAQAETVVQATDDSGNTPLHRAAFSFSWDPSIAAALIESGADVNARNCYGQTPLHGAASYSTDDPSVAEILIQSGAVVDSRDQRGDTPLHNAARRNRKAVMVRTLIEGGADVNARNWRGRTPLHEAAALAENREVVTALVQAGANVNAQASSGRTPLHFARSPTIEAILAEAGATRITIERLDNPTPLHRAVQSNPAEVPALIEAGMDLNGRVRYGETPLHSAAKSEDPLAATALVEAGADTNARAEHGETPLHNAVSHNQVNAALIVSVLIEGGADVNARNYEGETPLHVAALCCRDPVLTTLLLGAGADVHARDTSGATPIHYTAWSSRRVAVRARLVEAGADVHGRDWCLRTLGVAPL